jgi:ElaA protein
MQWITKPFSALSTAELYALLQLRAAVFVVEQNCVYQDLDGHDQNSLHVMGWEDGVLLAYCRVLPPGEKYAEWAIGRVVTSPKGRGRGLGQQLTTQAIAAAQTNGPAAIRISAQAYLEKFYTSHGFKTVGAPYDEDGIPHLEMLREAA